MYKEYKPNMAPKKNPMPSQDPKVRAHNFKEVAEGYTAEMDIPLKWQLTKQKDA